MLAQPGKRLFEMHQGLALLTRRPDVLIVYAGHNEFNSLHSWSHAVYPYYLDDAPAGPFQRIGALLTRISPLEQLIEETLRGRKIGMAPPHEGRRFIDAPSHSVEEHAELLADFRSRLDAIVAYCERIGAVPVLVPPPGNDVGYEPDRSVLPPNTPRARREVFARDFEAARRLETADPARAPPPTKP